MTRGFSNILFFFFFWRLATNRGRRRKGRRGKDDEPEVVVTVFADRVDPATVGEETRRGAREEDEDDKGEEVGDDEPALVERVELGVERKDKDEEERSTRPVRLLVKVVGKRDQPRSIQKVALDGLFDTSEVDDRLEVDDELCVLDGRLPSSTDELDTSTRELVEDEEPDDDQELRREWKVLRELCDESLESTALEDVPHAVLLDGRPCVGKEAKRKHRDGQDRLDNRPQIDHLFLLFLSLLFLVAVCLSLCQSLGLFVLCLRVEDEGERACVVGEEEEKKKLVEETRHGDDEGDETEKRRTKEKEGKEDKASRGKGTEWKIRW